MGPGFVLRAANNADGADGADGGGDGGGDWWLVLSHAHLLACCAGHYTRAHYTTEENTRTVQQAPSLTQLYCLAIKV